MFYPSDATELYAQVREYLPQVLPRAAMAIIAPHAGYIYSGRIAGATFAHVEITPSVLILCPKHTANGSNTAIMNRGVWAIPGTQIPIDEALADHLLAHLPDVSVDASAHAREHSLEVMLPFLSACRPDTRFVPLALGYRTLEDCQTLGYALANALKNWSQPVLIIASSDMNHQENLKTTLHKDQLAIDCILQRDPAALYQTCRQQDISMCGVIPATTVLYAAEQRDDIEISLIAHSTSADVTGDHQRVVGYAGMALYYRDKNEQTST
jgi:hypothetical protein